MINDIVLKKDEFKALDLKMVGTYGKDVIYKGSDDKISYLLHIEHDEGIGNYYKGIRIQRIEPIIEKHIRTQEILLDVKPHSKYDALAEDNCPEFNNHKRLRG